MRTQDFIRDTLSTVRAFLHPTLGRSMDMEGTLAPTPAGKIFLYEETKGEGTPVVLVHSVNAAASSYEMRPLFESLRGKRPVLAFDLPGFGRSERGHRDYDRSLYREAVGAMIDRMAMHRGGFVHVVALSLGCELAAAAALARPEKVRSLAFIAPTGLGTRKEAPQENAERGRADEVMRYLDKPILGAPLFAALASWPSIYYFLSQSFVGHVNEGLASYAHASAHQPGARYAPLAFLSGRLFDPRIVADVYDKLTCPVAVLYDKDPYSDYAYLKRMQENPTWTATRIAPSRGMPQFEELDATMAALRAHWMPLDAEDARMDQAEMLQPGF
ncbi:MAG: alpha/beta fold hydrolase [Polyangiaceae bacterium]